MSEIKILLVICIVPLRHTPKCIFTLTPSRMEECMKVNRFHLKNAISKKKKLWKKNLNVVDSISVLLFSFPLQIIQIFNFKNGPSKWNTLYKQNTKNEYAVRVHFFIPKWNFKNFKMKNFADQNNRHKDPPDTLNSLSTCSATVFSPLVGIITNRS